VIQTLSDLSIAKTQRAGTSGTFTRDPVGIVPLHLVGSTVEYQLVMTINGPTAVTGATFPDAIPSTFTFISIVSQTGGGGATACTATENPTGSNTVTGTFSGQVGATCTVVIRANAPFLATQGSYTNTATISTQSGINDTDTTNNSCSVNLIILPAADLEITKSDGLTATYTGDEVTYTIAVTNKGPPNIYAGAQHNAQLEASYNVTLSNPAQTISGASNTRQDTTLVGSAGLELTKKVRKVASCPSTAADTAVFSTVNEATTLDKLEYEITYKNNSVKNLQNVKVKDSVPTGTTFGSISCQSTPSGNSCDATRTGEALLWQLTGNLTPASSGTVRFCVTPQ
jgi:uncharacterized repeat protein (TIGR01451 family)